MNRLRAAGPALLALAAVSLAQALRFETATITRNQSGSSSSGSQILPDGKVVVTNATVRDILHVAYDIPDFAIEGAPVWLATERFDITAQAPENASRDQLKEMMRELLAERFKLVVRQERRPLPVLELRKSRADGTLGPNLIPARTNCETGGTSACPHEVSGGSFTAVAMPIRRIVLTLAEIEGRPVVDKTNLSGLYDVRLTWTTNPSTFRAAVQDQLGLELKPVNEPAEVLVIDSVERLQEQ